MKQARPLRPLDRERAFLLIFRRKMIDVVWSWLVRLDVPEQDRDDILQEVFYQALRSFHTYDPTRSRPVRWLNKIAVHLAGHYRERAYHRREQLCPELPPFAEVDAKPLVLELIEAEQERRLLYDLLQAIEPELRSVLVAHDIDEIPMAEIAEQRGIPLSTAYKWRARALEILASGGGDRGAPGGAGSLTSRRGGATMGPCRSMVSRTSSSP